MAGNILWSGWRLLKLSISGLMDMAPDAETLIALIEQSIEATGGGAMQAHDLKARVSGPSDLHRVPSRRRREDIGGWGARDLRPHGGGDRGSVPGARVSIHVEPEDKAHRHGGINL